MALFDFTGSIDVPEAKTIITNNKNTDTSDDKESDSMPVIDNEDKEKENNQQEDKPNQLADEPNSVPPAEEEEKNIDIIDYSNDTILKEESLNEVPSPEIEQKITPDKKETIVSDKKEMITQDKEEKLIVPITPVKIEYTALSSSKISGIVFLDEELDSIYHKYSIGINNIVLKLYGENNELIAETVSRNFMHNSGYFEFNNISSGKYKITFSIPGNMFISPQRIQKYFGSKASRYYKAVIVNIDENDVSNVFIGLCK